MLSIRHEQSADVDAVRAVHDAAFARPHEGRLVDALRARSEFDARLSLVAEDVHEAAGGDRPQAGSAPSTVALGGIVGHVLFTPMRIEGPGRGNYDALALAPMAVVPARQRQGVGSALVRAGLEQCRALGHGVVIVLGHGAYYPRFGFAPARARGIESPFDVTDDVWMVVELIPHALDGVRGTVRYPEPFARV